VLEIQW